VAGILRAWDDFCWESNNGPRQRATDWKSSSLIATGGEDIDFKQHKNLEK